MAAKVYECFEMIGFGEGSHITIKEVPGPKATKYLESMDYQFIAGLRISIGSAMSSSMILEINALFWKTTFSVI